jgi:hypothetical protein
VLLVAAGVARGVGGFADRPEDYAVDVPALVLPIVVSSAAAFLFCLFTPPVLQWVIV